MANYALYLRNDREKAFKFLGVIIHDEAEALANTAGQKHSFSRTMTDLERLIRSRRID